MPVIAPSVSAVDPSELDAVNNACVAPLESNCAPDARLSDPSANLADPFANATEPSANLAEPPANSEVPLANLFAP